MTQSAGQIRRRYSRPALAGALAAAIAGSMFGCESPLGPDFAEREGANYTNALIAKAVLDANGGKPIIQTPTVASPVRELARVDQAGPATAVTPSGNAPGMVGLSTATMPATTSPGATSPADRGLLAAGFNSDEPIFNLSLQDAIARAMKHSLAIKVEGYNPAIKESMVVEAEAPFDPVVFGSAQWSSNDDPSIEPGGNVANGQNWYHQLGIKELLPTGGTAQASVGLTYRDVPDDVANGSLTLAPGLHGTFYQAALNLQLSQPLLKGFGADVNEATIYLGASAAISGSALRRSAGR